MNEGVKTVCEIRTWTGFSYPYTYPSDPKSLNLVNILTAGVRGSCLRLAAVSVAVKLLVASQTLINIVEYVIRPTLAHIEGT